MRTRIQFARECGAFETCFKLPLADKLAEYGRIYPYADKKLRFTSLVKSITIRPSINNKKKKPMDKKNNILKSRKSIRIPDYNYAQEGMYFITVCSHQSKNLFGHLKNDSIALNTLGEMVQHSWNNLPKHFPHASTDTFVIMPNHVHGIIAINESQFINTEQIHGTSRTLGSMVRCFKACVTKWAMKHEGILKVWQNNYYEHVIRDEDDYLRVAEYIQYNPLRRVHDDHYHHG